jgi:cyclopropane-fatty-acyl-phospholipid synthase
MSQAEKVIRELLAQAEIEVNGSQPWDVQVHNPNFYERVLSDASLGLGEAYMDGWWDCPALDEFINRALKARLDEKVRNNSRYLIQTLRAKLLNRQSRQRAYQVGEQHYDLGNDLYRAMLDKRLNYTCGYWRDAKNLDEAQEAKLELVCRKLSLKPGMKVLELGCGWGSFAKYAAEKYGVSVLGVTVSKEYDAVISIGVMEHVGPRNYSTYMQVVERCLKPNGIGFIHTIGTNQNLTSGEPFTDKYIFPNGVLPSLRNLTAAMAQLFVIEDIHNIGPNYDPTLMAWYANFEAAWPTLKGTYGERFFRMWRYYLLSSAGGFRSRNQQLWQIVFTRQGTPQPECRFT